MKLPSEKDRVYGKRLQARIRFPRAVMGLILIVAGTTFAQMKPGDRRKAYGEARASVIESLLTTIYTGAKVLWDPALMVRVRGEQPRMVEVPLYVRGSAVSGGLEGVATIELEGKKQQFIFEAQHFQRTDRPVFPTEFFIFRADPNGHIQKYKKLMLDATEALTEIKIASIQDWSQREWPTLEIQYATHRAAPNSFTTIEWHSIFDANSGQFISRLPMGITRKVRGGAEQSFFLGFSRNGPATLLITNRYDGETHPYKCSDPCVVDAGTLLSEWKLTGAMDDASPATIHLKNGRIIHADMVKEADEKVEYIVGESVYKIPKNLVQEIVHSGNAFLQNDKQRSPKSEASQSYCEGDSPNVDPRIPCHVVFYIQVLMGLGETQRFALIDQASHDLTAQAQWTIIDYGSLVDFSVVDGVPQIVGKKYGMVSLYGTVGDDSALSRIYISKPEDIAGNTMGRRGTPTVVGTRPSLRLVPAAPQVGRIP